MSLVKEANWSDLGYSKVGPANPGDSYEIERTRIFGEVFDKLGIHEVFKPGDEVWIRDRARKKGIQPEYILRKIADFDRNNFNAENAYDFIEKYKNSGYVKKANPEVSADWEELIKMARDLLTNKPIFKAVSNLSFSTLICEPDLLISFLKYHAFKNFFEIYPEGKILIYEKNYNYEKRYGAMRASYSFNQYPLSELQSSFESGFATLRKWQSLSSAKQPELIAELGAFSFYPIKPYFISGPVGFIIFYIFDRIEKHKPKAFPTSWMHYISSKWDFGNQSNILHKVLSEPDSPEAIREAHGRLVNKKAYNPEKITDFIDWLVERYNELAFHYTDPSEFIDSDNKCIDFITAFEYGLSIDRVIRKSLSCITSGEHIVRNMAAMEIADILDSLRNVWQRKNRGEWFKNLFNPVEGKDLVLLCLDSMPEPFKSHFKDITNTVYDDLLETIKNSVWIKSKITETGILVKDKDMKNESEESWPDFVSNVIRSIRNTHHGYFTYSDPQLRPSRYLALIDGNIPVSISYLGVLWTLALLGNPKEMIGWDWMPIGKWD